MIRWAENEKEVYVVVIEPELEGEVLSFVESTIGALELNMPEWQVIGGKGYF